MEQQTNQKPMETGKKIRAFLYRIITIGSLFTMIFSGIMGREALINLGLTGSGLLSGNIFYLTEFREYVTELYLFAMTGYAGAGDDNGNPLTGKDANEIARLCSQEFSSTIKSAHKDILFHLDKNGDTLQNYNISYPLFSEADGHLLLPGDVTLCLYWDGPGNRLYFFGTQYPLDFSITIFDRYTNLHYRPNLAEAANIRLLIAIENDDFFYGKPYSMNQTVKQYQQVLITFCTAFGIFLFGALFCLFSRRTARQMWQDYKRLTLHIPAEVKTASVIVMYLICYNYWLWDLSLPFSVRAQGYPMLYLYMPMGILLYLFFKDFTLNKIEWWKHSMVNSVIRFIRKYLCAVSWYHKMLMLCTAILITACIALACGITLLGMTVIGTYPLFYAGIILPIAGILLCIAGMVLVFIHKYLNRFTADVSYITDKLARLREGTSDVPLVLSDHSLLHQTATDINSLEQGIEAAVEQQNRSNRMRVELITNVSHDLKTPLTSIINYADLLCNENLPAPASEYASALQAKAYRLKGMVQDVFELSKATSGNLSVNQTVLDLAKLMKQTLADMDERIAESTLTVKLHIATEPIWIEADGEKLYRVFQNLIVNALQYSLENSRIHIQLLTQNNHAYARIKNTSRQELDFDPAEIVERFVRADSSRTTEGSGLGLSIVQSFTEACGGSFHITTDADMFTACVAFPLTNPPAEG